MTPSPRSTTPPASWARAFLLAGVATVAAGSRNADAWPTKPVNPAPAPAPVQAPPTSQMPRSPSPRTSIAVPPAAPVAPAADAAGALERARAAYEYGDIDEMVESSRQVSEGRLHPTAAQRAYALRYLGIGLFLTGRLEGAETAFFELLRLRPESKLDPQTTRPDAVAFFEQVRLRYAEPIRDAARANNRKSFAWNFLPPAGQFQNGHTARAITIGGIELLSLTAAITSWVLLKSWETPHFEFPGREDEARAVRIVNWASVAVLTATYIVGVIDGMAHYSDPQEDAPPSATPPTAATAHLTIAPTGISATF